MSKRNGCTGKIRHRTWTGAVIHLKKLKEPGMNAYRCRLCGGWHVGHSDPGDGFQARLDRLIGPDPRTQTMRQGDHEKGRVKKAQRAISKSPRPPASASLPS